MLTMRLGRKTSVHSEATKLSLSTKLKWTVTCANMKWAQMSEMVTLLRILGNAHSFLLVKCYPFSRVCDLSNDIIFTTKLELFPTLKTKSGK